MITKMNEISGLKIEVEKYEDTSMRNGEAAFIIYLKLHNETDHAKKINLLKATYVTSQREQLEQDVSLSGYHIGEGSIKPNSFKTAGLVFYKSKLKQILENDLLYVSIELPKDGTEINLCFRRTESIWSIIEKEQTEVEIKLSPSQLQKKLLKKIERLESFEERLGVSFENISININNDNRFSLFCEMHSNAGATINNHLNVECVLYDLEGSILDKESRFINKDIFFGFELIEIEFYEDNIANKVNKIRLYPKK